MTAGSVPHLLFAAAVFFAYWTAAGHKLARQGVILLANYHFCSRFGLFYLSLLPACSTLDYLIGLGLMRWSDVRVVGLAVDRGHGMVARAGRENGEVR